MRGWEYMEILVLAPRLGIILGKYLGEPSMRVCYSLAFFPLFFFFFLSFFLFFISIFPF